jgi:hypothetical protein
MWVLMPNSALSQCAKTVIVNKVGTWTDYDGWAFKRAKYVCWKHYGPDTPCLTKFWKNAEGDHWAACGVEEKR